jgi:hypothetical protein
VLSPFTRVLNSGLHLFKINLASVNNHQQGCTR